jgi:hypothetical protein
MPPDLRKQEHASKAYSGIQFGYADLATDLSSHPLVGRCDVVISTEVRRGRRYPEFPFSSLIRPNLTAGSWFCKTNPPSADEKLSDSVTSWPPRHHRKHRL